MSDEQADTATAKRPPGRPRGSKTKPKPPPVRRDPVHRARTVATPMVKTRSIISSIGRLNKKTL
jgi:hypothetical protein